MKTLTPEKAYEAIREIEKRIIKLHEKTHEIRDRVAPTLTHIRARDIIGIRQETTRRVRYYNVVSVSSQLSVPDRRLVPKLVAYPCTKAGLPIGLSNFLGPDQLARAFTVLRPTYPPISRSAAPQSAGDSAGLQPRAAHSGRAGGGAGA